MILAIPLSEFYLIVQTHHKNIQELRRSPMTKEENPVQWFEIPVNDMDRAKNFYENVLNVELTLVPLGELIMAWFPWVKGGVGSAGTLVKAKSYVPSHAGSIVYFSVDDIEATLARVATNGGKILKSKSGIGENGFVGHFEDSEGNRVALHSTI
jgi:predicted enzyme related to lactoylglutathione lyase